MISSINNQRAYELVFNGSNRLEKSINSTNNQIFEANNKYDSTRTNLDENINKKNLEETKNIVNMNLYTKEFDLSIKVHNIGEELYESALDIRV